MSMHTTIVSRHPEGMVTQETSARHSRIRALDQPLSLSQALSHRVGAVYVLAVVSVGLTFGLELLLRPYLAGRANFMIFILPIAVTSWYGGLVPGLLSCALSALCAEYFMVSSSVSQDPRILRLVLFVIEGVIICGLTEYSHANRRRWAAAALESAQLLEASRRANQAKDQFLAMASHDLRTPMTSIHGWLRLIRSGSLDSKKYSDALNTIERNVATELRLINDILDATEIVTSGQLKLQSAPVDLLPLVQSAVTTLEPVAQAKYIVFETQIDLRNCLVQGDADRLKQVMWNLLNNAVKYTPAARSIALRCRQTEKEAVIEVSDQGCGISRDFCPLFSIAFGRKTARPAVRRASGWDWRFQNISSICTAARSPPRATEKIAERFLR